ncbi:bifunctional diaminohydroxyphosphoribosylaminopyrimidine deaminase/5-amino-6-(5-phosphoribosylamino)uracil reductase RibD [Cellulomonas bogoriensis]|uniref:Riboflavin biosynthesis protein RibD n=1 Tax=Cellulomonas bogoriensis 69B4 = DSM 16987 TaxID=1386082 RepID=A0A0A0BM46_9CELL|nr:bifunctional diaminohydroxyphosphoribosylaminopyrimidine deaminase/5-amino-6-(5-phosphoribosylamino)uracil reductase RibD [Cellulomonas bogoriensis]KGM09041.1 DeoR faimly transcriptional regulator [Cellulomonas bogoriensis 69B4 = DSM 16987]
MRVGEVEDQAMLRALDLAGRGPEHGPNPRVGCVLLSPDGSVVGEGWHQGAGTPHAEPAAVAAARAAGRSTAGTTAVVTLEPCDHTGRTGPCTEVLLDAGVARVVVGVDDSNPAAAGGAARLRRAGVHVTVGVRRTEAAELVHVWATAVRAGRPFVTLKTASSLDGRVAARDGSSRWITGPESRDHAHRTRSTVDAIVVGTGTALADDPSLTARPGGEVAGHQPLRVVVGHRDVPLGARLRGPGGELVQVRTHDPAEVLAELARREVRHALVEGGPTLASAFLGAGLVDQLHAYLAPVLLGAGPTALGDIGVGTLTQAPRPRTVSTERLGADVLVVARFDRDRQGDQHDHARREDRSGWSPATTEEES